jgi:hypothetical protein
MGEDVNFAVQSLRQLLFDLNIDIYDLRLVPMSNDGAYMLSWKTKKGDYDVPIVYKQNLKNVFKLHNVPLMRSAMIGDFADSMIYSIIYNMGAAKDTAPVEFFFQALCVYWDQVFIDTMHEYYFRVNDALRYLKQLVYKNPTAEIDPHKWIKSPKFFIFYITSPSGNRMYYNGRLHEREDIKRVRRGEIY